MTKLYYLFRQTEIKIKSIIALILVLPLCACEDICPTVQDYLNKGIGTNDDYSDCLLCPIFDTLIDISKDVSSMAWDVLAPALIPIVGLATVIYVAIYTLKLVGSFGKQTANDYVAGDKKGLTVLMFKAAFIIFLLSGASGYGDINIIGGILGDVFGIGNGTNQNFLIQKIISPLLKSGLEIGQSLAVKTGNGTSFDFYSQEVLSPLADKFRSPWGVVFEMIRRAVYGFNAITYEPVAVGQAMMCNALEDTYNPLKWYYLMLVYGFILFIFGWLLTLGIGFYIVDILIDLMFAAVLLPLGVACAISDKTVSYTKNIWGIFVNIFFYFVMLGIILGMTMRVIDLCLGRAVEEISDTASAIAATGGALTNFLTNYEARIDSNEITALSEELWSNGSLLLTIVCLSIITKLITETKKLASKISGGSSLSNAGASVSAATSQHTMYAAKKIGNETYGRVIKPSAEKNAQALVRMTRLDTAYKWAGNKAAAARGFFTGGGSQGYRAWWRHR